MADSSHYANAYYAPLVVQTYLRITLSDPRVLKAPTGYHFQRQGSSARSRQTFTKENAALKDYRKSIIGLVKLAEFGERWIPYVAS